MAKTRKPKNWKPENRSGAGPPNLRVRRLPDNRGVGEIKWFPFGKSGDYDQN
jgi:hypothetical protein